MKMTRKTALCGLLGVVFVSGCFGTKGCKDSESFCIYCPGPLPPKPYPVFDGYDQVRPDSSFGWIVNEGNASLSGLRVAVNLGCDTMTWVRVDRTALAPGDSSRLSSLSTTVGGQPAGPPMARIQWNGGSLQFLSAPLITFDGWESRDDTSAVGIVDNSGGGTADSTRVRVETRYGIQVIPIGSGSIGPRSFERFHAATRDSAGVSVYPRVLEVLWVSHRCTGIIAAARAAWWPAPRRIRP